MHQVTITAGYAFTHIPAENLPALQGELRAFGNERGMKGLILIATEGVNSTVCGTPEAIAEWKDRLKALAPHMEFKDSTAEGLVFKRWSVKIKPEIVAIKKDSIRAHGKHRHVSPAEWNALLQKGDAVVIDTRNDYEVQIGKFTGAVDPNIKHFSQFPEYVKSAGIPKDKTVMLYCTGGIRCEKAIYAMEEQGYTNVVQLDGGILNYLKEFPHGAFEGECFVFDHRVAVDGHLQPSKTYVLCDGCGNPSTTNVCTTCACILSA